MVAEVAAEVVAAEVPAVAVRDRHGSALADVERRLRGEGDARRDLGGADLLEPRAPAVVVGADHLVRDEVGHDLGEVFVVGQCRPDHLEHVAPGGGRWRIANFGTA